MTTKESIERYFDRLAERNGWEASFADDVVFTSFTSPIKQIKGKPYLQATQRFYSSIASVQVRELMVSGDRACAFTSTRLRFPSSQRIHQAVTRPSPFLHQVPRAFACSQGKENG